MKQHVAKSKNAVMNEQLMETRFKYNPCTSIHE